MRCGSADSRMRQHVSDFKECRRGEWLLMRFYHCSGLEPPRPPLGAKFRHAVLAMVERSAACPESLYGHVESHPLEISRH